MEKCVASALMWISAYQLAFESFRNQKKILLEWFWTKLTSFRNV